MPYSDKAVETSPEILNREIRSHGIAVGRVANELLAAGNQKHAETLSESAGALVDMAEKLEKRRQHRAPSRLPRGWVAIDTRTGATDGLYADQDDANSALERLKIRFPGGSWFLFALHSHGDGDVIPEAMFWRNRLATPEGQGEA